MKNYSLIILSLLLSFSAQSQIFKINEGFEEPTISFTPSSTGSGTWAISSHLSKYGQKSDSCRVTPGDTNYLTSNTFSTIGSTKVFLEFEHICKVDYFDGAFVQVSTDNGLSWITLTNQEYEGGSAQFDVLGNKFIAASYISLWQSPNANAIPTNSWWVRERFDLSALLPNTAQAKLRFMLADLNSSGADGNYGWLIDDIKLWIPSPQEATALSIELPYSPNSHCGLENEVISLHIFNSGTSTINGNLSASFQKAGGSIITETVTNIISSYDTSIFTFATRIPLATNVDTQFYVKAWVHLLNDSLASNDTAYAMINSRTSLALPLCNDTSVPFNTQAMLYASHTDSIVWYSDSAALNPIHYGSTYITPALLDTCTYYVQAQKGISSGYFNIGNGTLLNTASSYPAPYGNYYTGVRHQMLIKASEISATGMLAGHISSLAFNVAVLNGVPLTGFAIKMGHTNLNSLTSSFTQGLQTVYSSSGYTETTGWNTHTFQTPFYWDGVSNLLVETCFDNYPVQYTYNATVYQMNTSFNSCLVYNADDGVICNYTGGTTYTQRPNMKFFSTASNPPCPSKIKAVSVNVTNIPHNDAGILSLNSPKIVSAGISYPVELILKNFGADTLKKAIIEYSVNDVPRPSFVWTGSLLHSAVSTPIVIGNETFTSGLYTIKSWSKSPNDSLDGFAANDTATQVVYLCLQGSYVLGSAGVIKSFESLKFLLDSAGLCGPTTIKIPNGTYTTNLVLDSIKGSSALNTLTLTSESGNPNDVIIQYTANSNLDNFVIKLNNARNIKISKLTIKSKGANYGYGIVLTNGSSNNRIDSCLLIASAVSSINACPIFINAGNLNRYNTISHNTTMGGYYGIYVYGGTTTANMAKGNSINRNEVGGYYLYGIYTQHQDSLSITGNYVHDLQSPYGYGIYSYYNDNSVLISKNKIVLNPTNYADALAIYYMNRSIPNARPSYCINNMVSIISGNGASYGLHVKDSDKMYVMNNSVSIEVGGNLSRGLYQQGSTNISNQYYKNNIFVKKGNGYAAYFETPSCVAYSNYNCYYTQGTNFVYYNGANRANMAALQLVSSKDAQSVSADPQFFSITDLHTSSLILNGAGSPDAQVIDDFDGDIRDPLTPDIGADEYYFTPNDAGILAMVEPQAACPGTVSGVIITLKNFGIDSLKSCIVNWSVNGILQAAHNSSDILAPNGTKNISIGTYSFLNNTLYELKFWASQPNGQIDGNNSNDTLLLTGFRAALSAGTYTIGTPPSDFSSIQNAVNILNNFGTCGPLIFNIKPGVYNETAKLFEIPGASATNTILFQSLNLDSASVVISSTASSQSEDYVVELDGADYITFNKISFIANGLDYGTVISLKGGANNNTFTNCRMQSSVTEKTNFIVVNGQTGIDESNTIIRNRIENGYIGIQLTGTSSTIQERFNRLEGNTIVGFNYIGIKASFQDSMSIRGNIIKGDVASSYERGIDLSQCKRTTDISYNNIRINSTNYGYGILIGNSQGLGTAYCLIANNFIMINSNSTGSYDIGISISQSSFFRIVHNSVHLTNTSTASSAFYVNAGTNIELLNNIWSNKKGKTVHVFPATAVVISNYNNFYSQATNFAYWGSNTPSFTSLKALSGLDQNSINSYPGFVSNTNLHIVNGNVSNAATPLSYITDDFDNEPRHQFTPDIGADEFPLPPHDIALLSILSPDNGCELNTVNLSVRLANMGSDTIHGGLTLYYSINNEVSFNAENFSGSIFPGDTLSYTFASAPVLHSNIDSNFRVVVYGSLTGDQFALNDTVKKVVMNKVNPPVPTISNQTLNYASAATLIASSPHQVAWYSSPISPLLLYSGNSYTTPLLFDTITYWVSAISLSGCSSQRIPLTVNVTGIPAGDLGIAAISTQSGCGLDTNETVSISIFNQGYATVNTNFSASFRVDAQAWKPLETVSIAVPSNDTVNYTFTSHANLSAPFNDTTFSIAAFIKLTGDPYQGNDTFHSVAIPSYAKPSPPTILTPQNIAYGLQANLTASSTDSIYWFASSTDSIPLFKGSTFTTPHLFDTTSYFLESRAYSSLYPVIGNAAIQNTPTTYPAPYGNNYMGAKHQMLILASELHAQGVKEGSISSLAFNVITPNGVSLSSFLIRMGHTSQDSLFGQFVSGLSTVYTSPSFTETSGWNTHLFQSPFIWNGHDNLVVETSFDNYPASYSNNAIHAQSPTTFRSTLVFNSDNGNINSSLSGTAYFQRPNMKLKILTEGCASDRVTITIHTGAPPAVDAGMYAITNPVNMAIPSVSTPISVQIKNYGTSPLTSANISYMLGNQLKYTYQWTGLLNSGQVSAPITIYNDIFKGGLYNLTLWVSNANGGNQGVNMNDTLKTQISVCMAGNYTIGDTTSDFIGFQDALLALEKTGLCGHVVFDIKPGLYTQQISLKNIPTMDSSQTVTFRSANLDSTSVVIRYSSQSVAKNYVVSIDSACFYRLSHISLQAIGNTYGTALYINGNSHNNKVTNCDIQAAPGSAISTAGIYDISLGKGCNQYLNNRILNGYYGVYTVGSSNSSRQYGMSIKDNRLENFNSYAIYALYQDSITIRRNIIRDGQNTAPSITGIYLFSCAYKSRISENNIVLAPQDNAVGIDYGSSSGLSTKPLLLANNFISIHGGIGVSAGIRTNILTYSDIVYNSIYLSGGASTDRCIQIQYGQNTRLLNNIFSNKSQGLCIYTHSASPISSIDYNNYFSNGSPMAYFGTNAADFTAFKILSGQDFHSLYFDPSFVSIIDPHLYNFQLNAAGTPVLYVETDIDGDIRNPSTPDIGADEFSLLGLDMALTAINSPAPIISTASQSVQIVIQNTGTTIVTTASIGWMVNGILQTPYVYNGTLPSGNSSAPITIGTFNFTAPYNTIKVWVYNPNNSVDAFPLNDTLLSTSIYCQPAMQGTFTIGASGADFPSFNAALQALSNCGINGNVNFLVNPGTYDEQLLIQLIPGVSATKRISFQSNGNDSTSVILTHSGTPVSNYTIRFDAANFIRFKHMTIRASHPLYAKTIDILNGANENEISNCVIESAGTSSTNAYCVYNNNTNDNANRITYNRIIGGNTAVNFASVTAFIYSKANIIHGNHFSGFYNYAIVMSHQDSVQITNNYIQQPINTTSYGINLSNAINGFRIAGNRIVLNSSSANYGIRVTNGNYNNTTDAPGIVANNAVSLIAGDANYALYLRHTQRTGVYYNSLSVNTGTYTYALYQEALTGQSGLIFRNNMFSNASSNGYSVAVLTPTAVAESDYNNFYGTSLPLAIWGGNIPDSLWMLQGSSGLDTNSISENPMFFSATDLHSNSVSMNNAAKPVPGITLDFDGELRSTTTPDIGCDEYTPISIDLMVNSILQPQVSFAANGQNIPLAIEIRNLGLANITSCNIGYIYAGGTPQIYQWSGNLVPGGTATFNFPQSLLVQSGQNSLCFFSELNGDINSSNDTLCILFKGINVITPNFCDNFDAAQDIWIADLGWERGTPMGGTINSPYSAPNVWMTGLVSNYSNNAETHLYSPFFDFSNLSNTNLSFRLHTKCSNNDGMTLQYTTDNGVSWIKLGYLGDSLAGSSWWYNTNISGSHMWSGVTPSWVVASYKLSVLDNLPHPVQFRFKFISDYNGTNEGVAIDNFCIEVSNPPIDAGVIAINLPDTSTVIGSTGNQVQITVANHGTLALLTIPIHYRINSQAIISETITLTGAGLLPGASQQYTFTTKFPSPASNYTLCCWSQSMGDGNPLNDSLCKQLHALPGAIDAGIKQMLSPEVVAIPFNNESVKVRIVNYGTSPFTSIQLQYQVGAAPAVTETWSGQALQLNDSIDFTFQTSFLVPYGAFTLCAKAMLVNDINSLNDEICKPIVATNIEEYEHSGFILLQNIPNPVHDKTVIGFELPIAGQVQLELKNVLGESVLTHRIQAESGKNEISLDLSSLPSGAYFYSILYNGHQQARKLILIR